MTEYHDHRDDCPFKFATLDVCDCVEKNMLDRIEALTEQLAAARDDAKEAEAYAEKLENEAVLSKAAYEWVSSLLLSVQQDCIKERQHAERLEAKLAKAVATERARIVKLLDGIDRTELDDNGWWETSFGAKFGEGILNAILKGESHE